MYVAFQVAMLNAKVGYGIIHDKVCASSVCAFLIKVKVPRLDRTFSVFADRSASGTLQQYF